MMPPPELRGPVDEPRQHHLPRLLGIEPDRVSAEHVVASLAIRRELLAPNGYLHAATLIALADSACGFGTLASVERAGARFTTVELSANLLATAREGRARLPCPRSPWRSHLTGAELRDQLPRPSACAIRCTQLVLTPRPTNADPPDAGRADVTASHVDLERRRNA